jgi:hypothetical protein
LIIKGKRAKDSSATAEERSDEEDDGGTGQTAINPATAEKMKAIKNAKPEAIDPSWSARVYLDAVHFRSFEHSASSAQANRMYSFPV